MIVKEKDDTENLVIYICLPDKGLVKNQKHIFASSENA